MDFTKLEATLKKHEGYRQFSYDDILGYTTVGYGRCLDPRRGKGISEEEALYLLRNDIKECDKQLYPYIWYQELDDARKQVLIELCFNVGLKGLLSFKNMIHQLKERNFMRASLEMLDSKWALQVGKNRSQNMAYRLAHGAHPS